MLPLRLRAIAVALLLLVPDASQAAVRTCGEIVASSGEDDRSETVARQKAMAGWIAAAAKFGPAFVLWRNAAEKSLSCMKLAGGIWRCQAYGRPCGVSQVPGMQPPGSLLPPGPTPSKRKGIDA